MAVHAASGFDHLRSEHDQLHGPDDGVNGLTCGWPPTPRLAVWQLLGRGRATPAWLACRLRVLRSDTPTGRCRPCIGADCIRYDHAAPRHRARGFGCQPWRSFDQRCRQSIRDQLPNGAAKRGGCRRASAAAALSRRLTVMPTPDSQPVLHTWNWQEGDMLRFWDELGNPLAIQ
jgi:hypothetical protein